MKFALFLCVILATAAAADSDSAIGRCLARIDANVDAAAGSSLKNRILALPQYVDDESRCISDQTTHCLMEDDQDACFARTLDGLTNHLRRVHSALPPVLERRGEIQAAYNAWMRKVRNGKAVTPDACKLPPNYPKVACAALSTGTALIEARDWQRNLGVLQAAQAQAGN